MAKKRKKRAKKRKKKVTKPVFERRKRKKAKKAEDEPPPDFDIRLGEVTQDEAYATILARLQDARDRLPESFEARIIIHPYADRSVDGELYIKLPEGYDSREAEFDLYEAFSSVSVGRHYWISVGGRYHVETDDERYKRNKGMTQVQTNYQRATPANIVEEHLLMRNTILKGMHRTFGQEATDLFIRLHWNPEDAQPKR